MTNEIDRERELLDVIEMLDTNRCDLLDEADPFGRDIDRAIARMKRKSFDLEEAYWDSEEIVSDIAYLNCFRTELRAQFSARYPHYFA